MAERGGAVRLVDVAERAGVSLATVSRSLTGASGVSPGLAERVRGVAESMGYVANLQARSLAGGTESSIGLIVTDIADPYFAEIASGLIASAAGQQRMVQLSHAATREAVLAQVRVLREYRVGAIVLAGSGYVDPAAEAAVAAELDAFRQTGGRVAVIGRHHLDADAVLPDNVEAGRSLGRHLLSLGHGRVALLAGPASLNTVADRLLGLTETLGDAVVHVSHHSFERAGGAAGVAALLDGTDTMRLGVTAIVALSDVMAIGVLGELRSRGLRVPHDLSVAGFDDIAVAADLSPALTTARLSIGRIGAEALALIEREPADVPRQTRLGHDLVVRASTGAAPGDDTARPDPEEATE
jgi:LacI family transcriptional regulator